MYTTKLKKGTQMMKKIILITLLPYQLLMGGFIMSKGKPLIKTEDSAPIATNQTELSTAGCTDSYPTTVNVNNTSSLASAVTNASTPTRIILANGNYSSDMILKGNSAAVCIEAVNQNQAVVTKKIEVRGTNITLSKIKFTGVDASIITTKDADDLRITKCTFDNAGKPTHLTSNGSLRLEIDHNTFKNFDHTSSDTTNILLKMHTYADDPEPAAHKIHHNYFKDITTVRLSNFATMQIRLRRSHTQVVGLGEHPHAYGETDNGWNFGREEWKMDDSFISYNYFDNCADPVNSKINGLTISHNTIRNSHGKINLRAGKQSTITNNYIFGDGKFDGLSIHDRNHIITNNYIENIPSPDAGIKITNGGMLSSVNKYEPTENITCTGNYIKDMPRGIYFGLKIDALGGDDLPPSGDAINNTFVNVDAPIHINTHGEPLMDNMTTTLNNTTTDPGWDISGAYNSTDATSGIVGAGR